MELVAHENYNRSVAGIVGILESVIARAKVVDFLESREITWVAYLGRITNIASGHAQKL